MGYLTTILYCVVSHLGALPADDFGRGGAGDAAEGDELQRTLYIYIYIYNIISKDLIAMRG